MYRCVCVYVCMRVRGYVYMRICVYMRMRVYVYTCVCAYVCMRVCAYVYTCICASLYMCICVYVCMCIICVLAYTRSYTTYMEDIPRRCMHIWHGFHIQLDLWQACGETTQEYISVYLDFFCTLH